jgi:hypothetical protein
LRLQYIAAALAGRSQIETLTSGVAEHGLPELGQI